MPSEPIPASPSECIEKARLLQKYDHDVAELNRTTTMLARGRPTLSKTDHEAIMSFTEKLRIGVEQAREALEQHVAEHGC
jgi:hypothetical protein